MKPFFKSDDNIKKALTPRGNTKQSNFSCDDCGLYRNCRSPKMEPFGDFKKGILLLGECPGQKEDLIGVPFIGESGQLLKHILKKFGIDIDKDCLRTNSIICRTPDNRDPSDIEVKSCRPRLIKLITEIKPKKIITLGKYGLVSLIGHRVKNFGKLGKWVGNKIPDQLLGSFIYPNYHPAFLLRNTKNRATELLFKKYLREAIEDNRDFPDYSSIEDGIDILIDERDIINYLINIMAKREVMTFDLETTGRKPYREGHKIICMSISTGPRKATSFPFLKNNKEFMKYLSDIMTDHKIKKTAHNISFENNWIRHFLGNPVEGWYWDSMIAAHILDNRTGITGLKHQNFIRYGILGYDEEVEDYISSKKEGGNEFNKMEFLFKKDPMTVLKYCGIDSKTEHMLYLDQLEELTTSPITGYNLFHQGEIALSDIESTGIRINTQYYTKQEKLLVRKIKRLNDKIADSKEADLYKQKTRKELNPRSDKQLSKLFYNILGYKPPKVTDKGNPSVDKDSMKEINTEFSNNVAALNELHTLKDKIDDFLREEIDGIVHPFFPLNMVRSYRGSSNSPNFHNIHKRDREANKLMRMGILPRPGHRLIDFDYKGIEVCMSACNHKDPVMIDYLKDKTKDMHRDQIMEILMIEKEQVTSILRYFGKNGFVFPEFYNDYYVNCAKSIWKGIQKENLADETPVLEHLKRKGIRNYYQFEKHLKEIEYNFWYKKFKVYREWKEEIWEDYQKDGYFDLLTGFRCTGLTGKKEVNNYPNQGPAFHLLLWSLIQINKMIKIHKYDTKIIGHIHDQIVIDSNPDEEKYTIPEIRKIMCKDVVNHFPWIIIPLEVEIKESEIDGNWYEMKERKNDR